MHWFIRNLIIGSLLAVGIFIFIFFSETGTWPILKDQWQGLGLAIVFTVVASGLLFRSKKLLSTYSLWLKNITYRFIVEIAIGVLIIGIFASIYIFLFIEPNISLSEEHTFWEEYWDGIVKFGIISIVLIYIYSLISFSIDSYKQYANVQVETLKVDRNQIHLRFEALKSQLSPHFLFNALNTISSLIYKDIKLAENYIRQLSKTYQYILQTDDKQLVPFFDELQMLQAFFFMEKIKYEECITLEVNVTENINLSFIPALTLQMLVENALKHNLISDEKILKIEIFNNSDNYILVRNNYLKKTELVKIGNNLLNRPQEEDSHNIGLTNIKNRYSYFTSQKIEVIFDQYFTVKLPVIQQNFEN